MCEEFHCLPAEALEAIENDVGGLIFRVMEYRQYAKAKQQYDEDTANQPDMSKRRKGGMIEVVRATMFDIAKERINAARERGSE